MATVRKQVAATSKRKKRAEPKAGRDLPARMALLIRTLRALDGVPQKELSERSGVSQGYLSLIESESRRFNVLSTLEAIAWELGLKLSELIEFAERPGLPPDLHKRRSKLVDEVLKLDL